MTQDFTTQTVSDGVWHIEDSRGAVMYLIAGSERALLIDTGWGVGDLAAHVATLAPLPLLVVNTHGHRDHVTGNGQFAEVYLHTRDLHLVPSADTRLVPVHDGYVFDLGGRPVRVIGVPGHSPGSICLLDERSRILFTGDSPRPGPTWLHVPTALTVYAFRNSMRRLRALSSDFDTIAPSHGKPQPIDALLDDLVACAAGIMSGELAGRPHQTRSGDCLLAEYGSAGILYHADRVHRLRGPSGERPLSPEVHADHRVTFRVKAPRAERVLLQSTPLMNALGSADDAIALQGPDAEGVWSLTVDPLPPDIYDYLFVIDGVSFTDPDNHAVQTGSAAPRSLLIVPSEERPSYHEAQDVPHGTLHCHCYASKTLGDVRDVTVYTPPGYEAHLDRWYPVLYLLHGGGDDARGWSSIGRAHLIMDNLLAQGKAEPMIIVMPMGHTVPRTTPWEERRLRNTELFERDLFTDVLPLVESTYRVQADREHRAMAGLSMGGGQTEHIGLSHLDTFSAIGILSSGMRGLEERHADLLADAQGTNEKLSLLFLGCGTLDPLAAEAMGRAHRLLDEAGIQHIYWTLEGAAHTWVVWRSALYQEFLPRLWR
jgi:enterochelin esterase-like enzyme/glyoxylase-like metal-dependent hydrolase (beta-lactamase superfamily II)